MILDWKNQYCESDCIIQGNLQIQCNPYQITKDIFHRTRTKYFKVRLEAQKTQNSQRHPEKEKWSWRNQAPGLQTILRSNNRQNCMVLAQRQTYRSVEQDRKPRIKPMTKEARIYNGEKTACSISGAGKTGQLHRKE